MFPGAERLFVRCSPSFKVAFSSIKLDWTLSPSVANATDAVNPRAAELEDGSTLSAIEKTLECRATKLLGGLGGGVPTNNGSRVGW